MDITELQKECAEELRGRKRNLELLFLASFCISQKRYECKKLKERIDAERELMGRPAKIVKNKRNRAKCKKCQSIIESIERYDFKWCACQEIAIDGGNLDNSKGIVRYLAKDFDNLLIVNDDESITPFQGEA